MVDEGVYARRNPIYDIPKMHLAPIETRITIDDDSDQFGILIDTGSSKDMSTEQDEWIDLSSIAGDTEEENVQKVTTADACVNTDFDGTFSWSTSYLNDTTSSPGMSSVVDADSYTTNSKTTLTSPARSNSSEGTPAEKKRKKPIVHHRYPEVIDVTNLRFEMPKYPNKLIDHFFLNPNEVLSGAREIPPLINLLTHPTEGDNETDRQEFGEGEGQKMNEEDYPEIRRRTPLSARLYAGVTTAFGDIHDITPESCTVYHTENESALELSPRQLNLLVQQSERHTGGGVKLKKGRTVANWQDVLSVAEDPSTSDSSIGGDRLNNTAMGSRPLVAHSSETGMSALAARTHSAEPIRISKGDQLKTRSQSYSEIQQPTHTDGASRNSSWKSSLVKGGLGVLGVVAALAAFIALIAPRDEPEDYTNIPAPGEGAGRQLGSSVCKADPPPSPKPCVKSDWSGQPVPRGVAIAYRCQVQPEKPVVMLVACRGQNWHTTFDFLHSCICNPAPET